MSDAPQQHINRLQMVPQIRVATSLGPGSRPMPIHSMPTSVSNTIVTTMPGSAGMMLGGNRVVLMGSGLGHHGHFRLAQVPIRPNAVTNNGPIRMVYQTPVPSGVGVATPIQQRNNLHHWNQDHYNRIHRRHHAPLAPNITRPQQPIQDSVVDTRAYDDNMKKCKNFFECLIKLSSQRNTNKSTNVISVMQQLINAEMTVEQFCHQMTSQLNNNYSNHAGLRQFLELHLPNLRYEMSQGRCIIEGLRPPPPMHFPQQGVASTPRVIRPIASQQHQQQRIVHPRLASVQHVIVPSTGARPSTPINVQQRVSAPLPSVISASSVQHRSSVNLSSQIKPVHKSGLHEDDDLNDVAAMGGVNLNEETKNIIAEKPLTARSCREHTFLSSNNLKSRLTSLARKASLPDVADEAIVLMAHATQLHLKSILERLSITSEHRTDQLSSDPRLECSDDVRKQLKFVEDLDKREKSRHELEERELIFKAAKSRARIEDPEQLKLKEKARQIQNEEYEREKQREANITALNAIGSRKKRKFDIDFTKLSNSSLSGGGSSMAKQSRGSVVHPVVRTKRAITKDLQFVLQNDVKLRTSTVYFKSFMK